MKKTAVFGGSFDPPHKGHSQILEFLIQSPEIEKVVVIPTYQNPLKSHSAQFSKETRLEMMHAWLDYEKVNNSPLNFSKVKLSLVELESEKTSYTVETLADLKKHGEFFSAPILVLGEDNLPTLEKWKEIETLLKSLDSLWIFPRKSHEVDPSHFASSLRALTPLRWLAIPIVDISSTQITTHSFLYYNNLV